MLFLYNKCFKIEKVFIFIQLRTFILQYFGSLKCLFSKSGDEKTEVLNNWFHGGFQALFFVEAIVVLGRINYKRRPKENTVFHFKN